MSYELTWFNNSLPLDIGNQPRITEYIKRLSNKIEEKNVENKINQIEQDYQDKLHEIGKLCKTQEDIVILCKKSKI